MSFPLAADIPGFEDPTILKLGVDDVKIKRLCMGERREQPQPHAFAAIKFKCSR